jgi:hypothetical protein
VLTGDVLAVRSFRVGADGGLHAVTEAGGGQAWAPGWNTAVCHADGEQPAAGHAAPGVDCTCGLYGYSDARWAVLQQTSAACLAVIAVSGVVMTGQRGLRAERARVAAIWLHPRVSPGLAAAVAAAYPHTAVFADRRAMLGEFPPTPAGAGGSSPTAELARLLAMGCPGLAAPRVSAAGLGAAGQIARQVAAWAAAGLGMVLVPLLVAHGSASVLLGGAGSAGGHLPSLGPMLHLLAPGLVVATLLGALVGLAGGFARHVRRRPERLLAPVPASRIAAWRGSGRDTRPPGPASNTDTTGTGEQG